MPETNAGRPSSQTRNFDDGLSIVIPIYNEIDAVGRLRARLETVLEPCDFPVEVLLVDDGSTDGSGALLTEMESEPIRILRHPHNRGYGAALKTGISHSRMPWIAITDADDTYPDERIPSLYEQALRDGLDMLIAARIGENVEVPAMRRPPKWVLRKLASSLSGHHIPDLNSGLRVMRRDLVERFVHLLPNGFSFTSTITLASLSCGYRIAFVPIDYHQRSGQSKIRPIYDTLNFLQLIIRTVLWFNPLRIFLVASFLLISLSFIVLVNSLYWFGQAMDTTFGVLFMTGVIVAAIGMLADLIDKRIR